MADTLIIVAEHPGAAIRVMRAAAGVPSGELARALGIHANTLRLYEAGNRQVPAAAAARARELLTSGAIKVEGVRA